MALDRKLARARLADAYCERAGTHQKDKNDDAAIADYEISIDFGARADGCSCDPYNPLIGLYEQDRRYDQVWEVAHKAWKSGKWIAPDLLSILQKESGRRNWLHAGRIAHRLIRSSVVPRRADSA